MGRARKRWPARKRVGQVSYYYHHGGWYLYYRDGRKPVRRRVSGTQSEAAAAAAQVNAQLTSGMPTFFSFRPITVSDLRQQFLDYHEYTLRSSVGTVNRYRTATQHLENFVRNHARSQLAHEVTVDGFIRYLRSLKVAPNGHKNSIHRHLRDKGVRYIVEVCRSLYGFAAKRRHLPPYVDNPFSGVATKRMRIEDAKAIFVFDETSELAFFQSADPWGFAIHFTLAKTGLRPGELVHLLIEDIDLADGWIHVRNKPDLGWQIKTGLERAVPIADAVKDVLLRVIGDRRSGPVFLRPHFLADPSTPDRYSRRAMARRLEQRVALEELQTGQSPSRKRRLAIAYSIWREAGGVKLDEIRKSFMRITTGIALPEATCPKSWRHTFATLLQEANVDLLIRQLTLGHKPAASGLGPLGMTTIYTHTSPAVQQREIRRAVSLWPQTLELAHIRAKGSALCN